MQVMLLTETYRSKLLKKIHIRLKNTDIEEGYCSHDDCQVSCLLQQHVF